jgi:hypothetical protein
LQRNYRFKEPVGFHGKVGEFRGKTIVKIDSFPDLLNAVRNSDETKTGAHSFHENPGQIQMLHDRQTAD